MEERVLYLHCAMRKKNMLQRITDMHYRHIVFSIRNLQFARGFDVTFSRSPTENMQPHVPARDFSAAKRAKETFFFGLMRERISLLQAAASAYFSWCNAASNVRIAAHEVHRPPGKALVGKGRNGPAASIIQTKFSDSSAILGLGLRTAPTNQFFGRPNLF